MKTDMERKAREIRNYLETAAFECGMDEAEGIEGEQKADEMFESVDFFEDMMGDQIFDACYKNGGWDKQKTIELVSELEKLAHPPMKKALENFKSSYPEVFEE